MSEEKASNITFEVRVSPGCAGTDPNASDWEVLELDNGQVKTDADIFNNLTHEEAVDLAAMWSKKKDEAEAAGQSE